MKMFVEHKFVNLIWGLEAFDRRDRGPTKNAALDRKIDRILEQIEKAKDRKWLKRQLRFAAEPDLAQRLYKIFISLPIPLDPNGLQNFCESCAKRRNEISHYGGLRDETGKYDSFIRDLDSKADTLTSLYHLHLLKEIGLDHQRFDFKTNHNWRLSLIERRLRGAGLLKTESRAEPNSGTT